ncbi:MAG: hypothetical protein L0221_05950, partial [Chloroflexi bacterium]|nr:hypothetical protein [Chloroflexota bacterium]
MAVRVAIALDAPDDALTGYGAGAIIRVQRSTTEGGSFVNALSEPVVAATYLYELSDSTGDETYWFRWRLENSTGTETGAWSAEFQGWDPAIASRNVESYATLDDLLLGFAQRPAGTDKLARMLRALRNGRARVDQACGYQGMFFRDPQSGSTAVRTFTADGGTVLHVHAGIIALAGIRMKLSTGADWTTVATSDVQLEYWANRGDPHTKPDDEPYDHVVFTGAGSYLSWPGTRAGVELTGAFQWPKPHPRAVVANIECARQELGSDSAYTGGVVSPPDLGAPRSALWMPNSLYEL